MSFCPGGRIRYFPPWPLSGPTTPRSLRTSLPHVQDHASQQALREFNRHWSALGEIGESNRVRRGVVRREDAELLVERRVRHELTVSHLEHCIVSTLPFEDADSGEPPQVRLAAPLKVHFVVELRDRLHGRI